MANDKLKNLKTMEPSMKDGVDITDSTWCDGGAKDSPVMNETNTTKQMTTGAIPKEGLGGMNNLKC